MTIWTEMGQISDQKAALNDISSDLEEKSFFLDGQEDRKQTALRIPLFPGRPHHEVLNSKSKVSN